LQANAIYNIYKNQIQIIKKHNQSEILEDFHEMFNSIKIIDISNSC